MNASRRRGAGRSPQDRAGGAGDALAAARMAVASRLADELLAARRLTQPEAGQVAAALTRGAWDVVWDLLAMGQARTAAPSRSLAEPRPGAAPAVALLQGLLLELLDGLATLARRDAALLADLQALRQLVQGQPEAAALEQARRRVALLFERQAQWQHALDDASASLKETLAAVLGHLAQAGESAGRFHGRLDAHRAALEGEPGAQALRRVAGALLQDTQALAEEIGRSRELLTLAHRRVSSFESRVRELEDRLAQTADLARNDPLTRALNRRGLEEVVRIEVARFERQRQALTVLMVDLDDFKRINDRFGHAGGDRALVHFVGIAQANLRSTDRIARTGGEEFVLILPGTPLPAALDAARRLQSALGRAPIPGLDEAWILTFSAGAAPWLAGDTLERLLERADAALYRAKQLGKNRIELAG
jgi:diguanylate cyclase